ncbi:MAG TPA: hypothetical protein ENJ82_13420 [Bacteroidetes bacterium]|nr:hypothetical protein [Bacteroidota bacterium]
MNAQSSSQPLTSTTLEIGLELLPVVVENWQGGYSLALTQAIKRANLPSRISLSLFEQQYERIFYTGQVNMQRRSREVYDLDSKMGWMETNLMGLNASIPFIPDWVGNSPIIEEVDPPQVEFLAEYREILGYKCQGALWTNDEGEAWEVWFTRELSWPVRWGALWGLPEIPGMILEQTERPGPGQVSAKHWAILKIDFEVPSKTHFTPSADRTSFTDIKEARQASFDLLKKDLNPKPFCHDRLAGPWKLDGFMDKLWLWLEKEEGQTYLHLLGPGQKHQIFSAYLGDKLILAVKPAETRIYKLDSKGNLLMQSGMPAFRFVRGSKKELKKFRKE